MSCYIDEGYVLDCRNSVAGIKALWILGDVGNSITSWTSSVDNESEELIQKATAALTKGRTAIVIAHRLSTIRHADEIIVLQKGDIVERGNHDELIAQNGYYKKLIEMQEVK